jgi:hypothetical protein
MGNHSLSSGFVSKRKTPYPAKPRLMRHRTKMKKAMAGQSLSKELRAQRKTARARRLTKVSTAKVRGVMG